jgi:tetratricopeptide (TPR) repeat protein
MGGFVTAQEWTWPERAKSLEVLPKDFPRDRLRAVMIGFTRSLGVRCTHCHVGQEGQPLSTYDFPSDANPNKGRAREMLRMLGSINEQLAKIEPSASVRVNMGCNTCHMGKPRPMTLVEALTEASRKSGVEGAIGRYRELREKHYGRGGYDFDERSLNEFGYQLLGGGDTTGAIAIFRLNTQQYPGSGNAFDSLAEAYLAAGQKVLSLIYYRKALELAPDDENALKKLAEIEKGKEAK